MAVIEKILDIINKRVPDTNLASSINKELRELDIKELEAKGTYIEKINKVVPFVLPAFLLSLLLMFTLNYLSDFFRVQLGKPTPVILIDDRMIEFCKWFVGFLFGKKAVDSVTGGKEAKLK